MKSLTARHRRFLPLIAAGVLLGVPITVGIGYMVGGALGLVGNGHSGALTRVLHDAAVWRSVALSLWIATAGTLIALLLALLVTFTMSGNTTIERAARAVARLPLPVPNVAAAVGMLLLLSQGGWLSRVAFALHTTQSPAAFPAVVNDPWAIGVIVAVVWKEMPFLLLVALSIQSLRGRVLSDAARTHGASRWQAIRYVSLPMLLRGLGPSVVAVFVFVLGSLELPLVLAPSSPLALPMLIQERRQALDAAARGESYVIALLATALALIAVLVHERLRDDAS